MPDPVPPQRKASTQLSTNGISQEQRVEGWLPGPGGEGEGSGKILAKGTNFRS